MSDVVLLLTGLLSLLIVALIALLVWRGRAASSDIDDSDDERITTKSGKPVPREQLSSGPRRPQRKISKKAKDSDEELDGDDRLEAIEEELGVTLEGKVGKKKLAKLEAKIEKRHQREMELQEREERKQRQEQLELRRQKEEEKRQQEEKERLEKERQEQLEKEQKELEEYLALKASFEVQEEGFEEDDLDTDDPSSNKLQQFIKYIQDQKVVLLEDLAAHFQLKTQDVINRVQSLLANETLVGVIDDRGKFIHVTREELESVAKFIRQRGRVSLTELVESSNSLINLTPVDPGCPAN